MNAIGEEYLSTFIRRVKYYKKLAEQTFEQLENKDFYFNASGESNSIAVIIQHLSGNMLSRFTNFLTEDGEKEWRQRDEEFEIHQYSKQELIAIWEKGWKLFLHTLETLNANDLLNTVHIRKEPLSVMDALNRQLAHYAYHIGQIIFIGKMLKDAEWKSLSIPKGQSQLYNQQEKIKDPARKF